MLIKGGDLSTAGLSTSPGEKSEQEYLAKLSAHYQVEHYEDCYNLTGQLEMINVSSWWWMLPCKKVQLFTHTHTDTGVVKKKEEKIHFIKKKY